MKDKILFWVNASLFHFSLAYHLQKTHDAEYFSIIDISNNAKNFFEKQNLIDFKKTWFYHDNIKQFHGEPDIEYLKSFETKYGLDLWKFAINERIFYYYNKFHKFSRNEILLILEQECKLYEEILDSINPDFFIIYDPPLHNSKILYELCRARGIKTLGMFGGRLGHKSIIIEDGDIFGLTELSEIESKNRSFEELKNFKELFNVSTQLLDYIDERPQEKTSNKINAVLKYIFHADSTNTKTNYSYFGRNKLKVLTESFKFLLRTNYRTNFLNKNLEKNLNLDQKFVYFPLQPDEEINILHKAPFYTNAIETTRHLAKSIPIDHQLFVKEHPGQKVRGWRSISEYKEILAIPNVILIHPSIKHETLVEKSSLVATIRGSSAITATLYGKPTLIFGNVPELVLPSVQKVGILDELPKLIQKLISTRVDLSDLDKYFTWLEKNDIDFDFLGYENMEKEFFYPGGILVDVDISDSKMKLFLEKNSSLFSELARLYVEKMKN